MASIERLNSLRHTAALWHQRADQEHSSAGMKWALKAWLTESEDHAAAYRSIERLWSQLKSASAEPAILDLRKDTARRLPVAPRMPRTWRWSAASLIVLSLGIAVWLFYRTGLEVSLLAWLEGEIHSPVTQSYVTNTGDQLTVNLSDGSKVTLNTETRLDVGFSKTARTVRLIRGQALFEVAKDRFRPFVVQTQNRRFIAVGTAFDVYIDAGQIKVTMLEGTVRAESIEAGESSGTTVTAGEQLIANSHAGDRVRQIDPQRETSWRHGQVIFDDTPLGEAVADLNRYSSMQIKLADPKLAELRLSGTFAVGGTRTFVEAVTAYFPVEMERTDAGTMTLKARK